MNARRRAVHEKVEQAAEHLLAQLEKLALPKQMTNDDTQTETPANNVLHTGQEPPADTSH